MTSETTAVLSLSFSHDGSRLAWVSNDHFLRMWDGSKVLKPTKLPGARYINFGTSLIAVSDRALPIVRFINADDLSILSDKYATSQEGGSVVAITAPYYSNSPQNMRSITGFFALSSASSIFIRSYSGQAVSFFETSSVTFSASFHSDASKLAVGDTKGVVRVWDVSNPAGKCLAVLQDHRSFVSSIAFSTNERFFISGAWDGKTKVWDLQKPTAPPILSIRAESGNPNKIHAVAVPDEKSDDCIFAAAGSKGTVRIWRIDHAATGSSLKKLDPIAIHSDHSAQVYALAFSTDGRHVASGSADGTVRILGVPTKPVLVSQHDSASDQSIEETMSVKAEGQYFVQSMDMIIKGQRADRRLIFCPSSVITLTCPICSLPYDDQSRIPICSGSCGHTYCCKLCNDKLWAASDSPTCPVCRALLLDVAPNYELLSILSATKSNPEAQLHTTDKDYLKLERLSWIDAPELTYTSTHNSKIFSGRMDGEVVAIRLEDIDHSISAVSPSARLDTERHLRRMRSMRGPHIAQFYGMSRTPAPDNRIVVVTELPIGGTLHENLSLLRSKQRSLSETGLLMLSLQLARTLKQMHESDVIAGAALSPRHIALSEPITDDWTGQHRLKIIELGTCYSKSECVQDPACTYPSSFTSYLAPELLQEDRSRVPSRDGVFSEMIRCDMYALGVLLWEICSGLVAFEGLQGQQIVGAVIGRGERPGFPPPSAPGQLQNLISLLWSHRAEERPNAEVTCEMLELIPSAPATG